MASTLTKKLQKLLVAASASPQSSAKPARKIARNGRSRRQAKRQNAMAREVGFTMQGSRMSYAEEPVALSCSIRNPTYLRVCGPVSHPDFGDGVRIEGRQLLSDVTTTGTDSQLFAGTGTATAATINMIQLSPDALNGRLALQARNYSRYAFRRVVLHYIPRVATSDVGQFAVAYTTDGAEVSFATNSFATLTSMAPSMVTPFRKEAKMEIVYSGGLSWFTELDSATNAGSRSSIQGEILGFPDASSIGALQHGWIWVEYVIDLYGQNVDYGFTVGASREEREAVKKLLQRMRKTDDDESEVDVISISGRRRK